ncbi:MAG TPA: hypothetical protein ENJ09_13945 [Planctomycetes bacterium]|nr:hypothetical protein [Planctomycetota bacterium]
MLLPTLLVLPFLASSRCSTPAEDDVRLIVLVSIDQMTPEQLERLGPRFSGGFARFLGGERHRLAFHDHADSSTGPGHATLGTGLWPSHSGIVGNLWADRAQGDAGIYCVADPSVAPLGPLGPGAVGPAGRSPALLLGDGLADHLKRASPGSRSVGIAGKDRAAILATGHAADWALWWDASGGQGFVSSTYYGDALPDWVASFDEAWWNRLPDAGWETLEASRDPRLGASADVRAGEAPRTFPHALPLAVPREPGASNELGKQQRAQLSRWVYGSPWIDLFSIELAERALDALDLGRDESVDYLFLGLSGCDIVGHSYGPRSLEVTDLLLRDDAALGELFDAIDARVGAEHWIAALSSDHGVLPLPESLDSRGYDAVRLAPNEMQLGSSRLGELLESTYGTNFVTGVTESGILLDREAMEREGIGLEELATFAREGSADWMPRLRTLFTQNDLAPREGSAPTGGLARLAAHSFLDTRSPDLVVVLEPWTLVGFPYGTSHGTPWPYDRHVPLLFLGPGSTPGEDWRPCATVDLVPSLLERAGCPIPDGLDGSPLH